jgi:hypothetical protein
VLRGLIHRQGRTAAKQAIINMAHQAGATSLGMQSENFGYSRVRLRRIKKLQFGVVNPNELVRI